MRIVVKLKGYYDWEPVPKDVLVTDQDVKSGRVKPDARGLGHLMRVKRTAETHTQCGLSELSIIARIVHEAMPQNGSRYLSRTEAVGQLMAHNVMPDHAHPRHMTGFVVENDDGPDEALFRSVLKPYTEATHDRSGEPLIDPEDLETLVSRYLETANAAAHEDHLHTRFGVKRVA